MSENQPINNPAFNPSSNPAFDDSQMNKQPTPAEVAPVQPVAVAPVMMVQQPKSLAAAYLLCIFLGGLGIHKFYLNQTGMGILYLCLSVIGWIANFTIIGLIIGVPMVLAVLVMIIIDLVMIPTWVNTLNGVTPVVVQQ